MPVDPIISINWEAVGKFIATVGFPVFAYILMAVKFNGKLDKLTDTMTRLVVLTEIQLGLKKSE